MRRTTSKLRDILKRWLASAGLYVSRSPGGFMVEEVKLRQWQKRGLRFDSVLDGGASDGSWTRMIKRIHPAAHVVCVEPRADVAPQLRQLQADLDRVEHVACLLSDREGIETGLRMSGNQSTTFATSTVSADAPLVPVPATTIDAIYRDAGRPAPDLLKLDLQGGELVALQGAATVLETCRAVVVEVSFIPVFEDGPLVLDVVCHLHRCGYALVDVLTLVNRPLDRMPGQADMLFLQRTDPLLADGRWSA